MLSIDPIDRPSLEFVFKKLKKFMLEVETVYFKIFEYFSGVNFFMEEEIRVEYIANEDKVRRDAGDNNINKNKEDSAQLRKDYKSELNKAIDLRKKYINYIGRFENCNLSATKDQVNIHDSSGLIPFFEKDFFEDSDIFGKYINFEHKIKSLEIELAVLIVLLIITNSAILLYFKMKNLNVKLYLKKDFPAKLLVS